MKNETLKAFYYGNLSSAEQETIPGSEAARAVAELSGAEDLLSRTLPADLLPVLERFTKAQRALDRIMAEASYIDGFKTGARLAMEILDDGRENLKPVIG